MHQLEWDLYLELLTCYSLSNNNSEQAWHRNGVVARRGWRGKSEDRNGAAMARKFVDSDNEIYLIRFQTNNCVKRKEKQNKHTKQSIYLYNLFFYMPRTQIPRVR
jgi:hypothetical protein